MPEYFVHGTRVTVDSRWARFLEYVGLNLAAFKAPRPTTDELRVAVSTREKPWFGSSPSRVGRGTPEERWGDDLWAHGAGVRFRSGFLDVEFSSGPPAEVRATYLLDRRTRIAGLVREVPTWEEVQKVARLALYLPLFHLKESAGWTVLHAGAVASANGAVVLAGLNGSGKTTLCSSLVDRLSYLSDNYVLWTGAEVLGFPEALRLPADRAPSDDRGSPIVWGKRIVPIDPSRTSLAARPRAIVFLTLGGETALSPLPKEEAVRRMEVIQDMTAEFPRYGYLGPLSPVRDPAAIRSLVESAPSFALTVRDTATARAHVLELAGETP